MSPQGPDGERGGGVTRAGAERLEGVHRRGWNVEYCHWKLSSIQGSERPITNCRRDGGVYFVCMDGAGDMKNEMRFLCEEQETLHKASWCAAREIGLVRILPERGSTRCFCPSHRHGSWSSTSTLRSRHCGALPPSVTRALALLEHQMVA